MRRTGVGGLFLSLLALTLASPLLTRSDARAAELPLAGFNVPVRDLYDCRRGAKRGCLTLRDAAADGARVVRLNFAKLPLMSQKPPYAFDEEAFDFLRILLNEVSGLGLVAVIDPHAMPGADRFTTIEADDAFWTDAAAQDALVALWRRIGWRTRGYGDTVHAFDLINEPYAVPPGGALNALYRRLVRAVRHVDPDRSVILDFYPQHYHDVVSDTHRPQPPRYYDAGDAGRDGNARGRGRIYYSTHLYWPLDYTHQGISIPRGDGSVREAPAGQRWPDPDRRTNDTPWTAEGIARRLVGVTRFADTHGNWRMFVGEFSSSACADCAWDTRAPNAGELPANGGDVWLDDVVSLMNDRGWSWTYHSLNGAAFWDAAVPERRRLHLRALLGR